METRNVKVCFETAKRWYEQGGQFKEMALSAFTEAELNPVRNEWEKKILGKEVKGCYIANSKILVARCNCDSQCKNIYKTEKQAKSALAYAQLTQLMALPEYNGDWVPDWNNDCIKYTIERWINKLASCSRRHSFANIFFKSVEIRDKFFENNYDLLKEYFELD